MSRSYQRHYCSAPAGIGCNKWSRTNANRTCRRKNKVKLEKSLKYDEDFSYVKLRECSDVWAFRSDGLAHFRGSDEKSERLELWSDVQAVLNCPDIRMDKLWHIRCGYTVEGILDYFGLEHARKNVESLTEAMVAEYQRAEFKKSSSR
jgi:hypothetical protein